MKDQTLRITPAHAAGEHQGSILGLDLKLAPWAILAFTGSLALFAGLLYNTDLPFTRAFTLASMPTVLVVFYLRLAHQGKPPALTLQWLEQLLTGGHAVPPRSSPPHPLHDPRDIS